MTRRNRFRFLIHAINYAPELTGIGKYTGEIAEWLASRGHEVRVVTAPPYYPEWRIAEGYSGWRYRKERIQVSNSSPPANSRGECAVTVYRCPLWVPRKQSGFKRLLHLASFALSSFPVMLWQMFWRPDVVLVVEPPLFCAPQAWLTARLAGAKAWLHVQDFEVDAAFELGLLPAGGVRRIVEFLERWLLRRFDRVSAISMRMVERLVAKGVPAVHTALFPNWVDTRAIFPLPAASPYRAQLGIPESKIVALYSGNMGEKQGLEMLIDVARRLQGDNAVQFVLCGEGAARRRLYEAGRGVPNIRWLPLQPGERLNELLNLADIHLLPQRADAADLVMPSKLLGMLASGQPVIATAAEGTGVWSVVEGRGVNTPPGDVRAFADAIRGLVHDPERRADLGQRGRCYAEEYLSRDKVLGRFEAELLQVAGV